MGAAITLAKSLPPNAQSLAQKMELIGFPQRTWRYVFNHELADMNKVFQNRGIEGLAKKNKIDRYKTILKPFNLIRDQLTMPPVVFTADGWLLDGNTRTIAVRDLGWLTFPAMVLNFSYEGDTPQQIIDQMHELAAVLNLGHGDNLDKEGTENAIARLLKDDTSPLDLARRLGVSKSTVQNVQYARKARLQAERLNISLDAPNISRSHLAELGRIGYDDPVYSDFVRLITVGKMSLSDQRGIQRRLAAETTEAAKVKLLLDEITSRASMRGGRATKPQPSARLRQIMGQFANREAGEFVETNPESFGLQRSALLGGIGQLQKIYDRQLQMEAQLESAGR